MRSCSSAEAWNFYPRPPGGGRPAHFFTLFFHFGFLSTPSGWRATGGQHLAGHPFAISIHALRVEGDPSSTRDCLGLQNFYPRPPGGGRHAAPKPPLIYAEHFYPRPPGGGRPGTYSYTLAPTDFYPRPPGGGRPDCDPGRRQHPYFYPRPPGGGRPPIVPPFVPCCFISIHALRVEGDLITPCKRVLLTVFLSTPSGWRATLHNQRKLSGGRRFYPRPPGGGRRVFSRFTGVFRQVSIHALRVEGDQQRSLHLTLRRVSIHALRVEGDCRTEAEWWRRSCFYPRPPGGGRQLWVIKAGAVNLISIHALRVEGDTPDVVQQILSADFYPRPPGGGRQLSG